VSDDNLLPFRFPIVYRKKITAAFDGGRISSDGGVMLLAPADRRLRIVELLVCSQLYRMPKTAARQSALPRDR
jgi:hypothetical protein